MDVFTHLVLGFVMYYLFGLALPVSLVFWAFMLGNWIPDIDHLAGYVLKQAKSRWNISEKRMKQYQRLFYFPRTFVHSIWGSLAFFGLFWVASGQFMIGFSVFLGTLLHLAMDSFDQAGVKWFYPFFHIKGKIPVSYLPRQERVGMTRLLKYIVRVNAAAVLGIVLFKFIL